MKGGNAKNRISDQEIVNASTVTQPGSGNQDMYAEHFALMIDANRSISRGPNLADNLENATCDRDHSVSMLIDLDS